MFLLNQREEEGSLLECLKTRAVKFVKRYLKRFGTAEKILKTLGH